MIYYDWFGWWREDSNGNVIDRGYYDFSTESRYPSANV